MNKYHENLKLEVLALFVFVRSKIYSTFIFLSNQTISLTILQQFNEFQWSLERHQVSSRKQYSLHKYNTNT